MSYFLHNRVRFEDDGVTFNSIFDNENDAIKYAKYHNLTLVKMRTGIKWGYPCRATYRYCNNTFRSDYGYE